MSAPSGSGGLAKEAGAALCLVLVGLWLGLPRYLSGIDLADEGMLVYGAQRVLSGELPNRDFVSLQPPLSYYTVALVFRVLGTSLASARLFGLLLYLLIPLGVYAVSRQFAGRAPALAAALPAPFLGMTIWVYTPYPTAQGLALTLAASWLLLRAVRAGGGAAALGAGACAALVGLTRHDQGFYLVASTVLFLAALWWLGGRAGGEGRASRRLALRWLAGAAGVLLPLVAVWGIAGALPAMFRDLVRFPLTRYAETSSLPMPWFRGGAPLGEQVLVSLFYLAPLLAGGAALLLLRRALRGGLDPGSALPIYPVLLCLGFYHQVLTRSDVYHLVDTLPPLFLVTAFWLETGRLALERRLRPRTGRAPALASAVAAAAGLLFWGLMVWQVHPTFILPRLRDGVPLGPPRGGVRVSPADGWVVPTVGLLRRQVPPGRSMLALPYHPMFYFLADRRNPTRWNYLWPGDQTAEDFAAFIREARADPPAVVLLVGRKEMEAYARPVLEWVDRELTPAAVRGRLRFYVPASPGTGSRPDRNPASPGPA